MHPDQQERWARWMTPKEMDEEVSQEKEKEEKREKEYEKEGPGPTR